jgi:hypothetical protein
MKNDILELFVNKLTTFVKEKASVGVSNNFGESDDR